MASEVKRPGWTRRRDDYRLDKKFPSYELRLADDFWPTVHATPRPIAVWSPLGIRIGDDNGYATVAEAMTAAERLYDEALSNSRYRAQSALDEMNAALTDLRRLTEEAQGAS